MFAYHDGDMMKSLISPFGFGRTSKSTDIASNIPNLGIRVQKSLEINVMNFSVFNIM